MLENDIILENLDTINFLEPKKKAKKNKPLNIDILTKNIANPLWLSVSESAKICGITTKTVRRAIQAHKIKYKIIKNRYLIDCASIINYSYKFKKLKNKLNSYGIGQYIEKWRE